MDQDETWHAGMPRPWPHCVRWGHNSPPQKGGAAPQFSAHVCCGQMAAWIKMPLGMEVGLTPSDLVLDRDPALCSPKGGGAPHFSAHVYCGHTAGWIKMALGMEVGLGPFHTVLDGDPAYPPKRGQSLHNFLSIFIVAKWLHATRCHLVWRWASAQATLC